MAEDSPELKNVKSMLRSVLISCKEGVQANVLLRDYQDVVGESLPFRKLGFNSLEDFIFSIPDVVRVARRGQDFIFHAVADENTAHIKALVSKQRSKRKLKKATRRPRGGGAGYVPRPRGPSGAMSNQRSPGLKSTPGMPSFIPQQYRKSIPVMTVEIGNSSTSTRTIHVGRTQLLNKAMHDVHNQIASSQDRASNKRYEVPPRFRRQAQGKTSPPSAGLASRVMPSKRQAQSVVFGNITDGKKYLDQFYQYMDNIGAKVKFQTIPFAQGYLSSVVLNNQPYGSEDVFRTAAEAEQAAAKNAMLMLNSTKQQEEQLPVIDWNNTTAYESIKDWAAESYGRSVSLKASQIAQIKTRTQEILKDKKNGLWSTRIPFEYKDKFNEDPPDNLVDLLQEWTDIAKFETTPTPDRYIVFPVEEKTDENMNLVIPRDPLVKKNEEVVVYISYVYNPGYFCVQREDSCIDDIFDLLQSHCESASLINASALKKGMFCAGKFSGDGNWTRAEVLHLKDTDHVELLFVDYGNVETVQVSDIRWLSPKLAETPVQAVTCSLFGMEPLESETEWSSKSTTLFARHVEETALIAVPQEFYDDLVDVELYLKSDRSVNISKLLCDAGVIRDVSKEGISDLTEALEPEPLVLPEEKEWDVHVTYISSSTNSVMLRLVGEDYSDKLDTFQSELEKAFRKSNSNNDIVEGGIYVAYDDHLYHRVRAMSVEGKKVLCYFLDHGDTDHLLPEQLEPLDPKVNRILPYQAIEIRLSGLEEVSTNITALEKLCDMTLGKTCVAEVLEREEIPSLVLYDTSTDAEVNINETILKTIEMEGGGIDSPHVTSPAPSRVISPAPGSASSTPNRVLSPATSSTDILPATADSSKEKIKELTVDSEVRLQSGSASGVTGSSDKIANPSPHSSHSSINKSVELNSLQQSAADGLLNELKGLAMQESKENVFNEKSVLSEMSFTNPPAYQLPPAGSYIDVHVPFVFDPHNFVCIPFDEISKIDKVLMGMCKHFKEVPQPMNPEDIKKGCVYAAVRDDIWMRVKVQDFVGTDLVSVYSVDIGDYSVMMLTELQPLPKQFAELPMMAIVGQLGRIKPRSGTWFEAAKYKFIDLARGKDLVAHIQGKDEETGIVDLRLIDTSDENVDVCIDEVLVRMGFADPV